MELWFPLKKDVLAGVLLHFVKAPVPVDGFLYRDDRHGGVGQGRNAVPEDAVLLVDIGHGQLGAVRQGQGATVGRLTAAFRVEHRTFQKLKKLSGAVCSTLGVVLPSLLIILLVTLLYNKLKEIGRAHV